MDALPADHQATLQALMHLLEPVAQLCLARGVTAPETEELLRIAFVQAAQAAVAGTQSDRLTSRISTMTGLTRREVGRLRTRQDAPLPGPKSHASALVTRWLSLPEFHTGDGVPAALPRTGPAGSFEALAAGVTRDVHPGTLLAELVRLELARLDEATGLVHLLTDAIVPRGDWQRMAGHLGANVGDHLRGAVANVLGSGSEHFEQALLADELSVQSVQAARALIAAQWRHLLTSLGPKLEALMAEDSQAGRPQDQQVRIGLYSYASPMAAPAPDAAGPPAAPPENPPP